MSTCPACGRTLPDDARFCPSCGHALPTLCLACGAPLPAGAAFCPNCGTATAQVSAGDPTTPVAALGREDRRLVTVLFADLVGSTGLSERLGPERMRDLMHGYFEAVREPVEAEGGTLEKFIGDAVMAAFGVPDPHEDDAERALHAALGLRAAVARFAADVSDGSEPGLATELKVRIGVTTGQVIAEVDPRPGEPMVTGDAVNVAARLQSAAEPGEILVSARTSRAARGFAYGPSRTMQVRGRQVPVTVYPLLGVSEGPRRGIPGLWAPLIGRDRELELLQWTLQRTAAARRPHLVTVYGDAGIGKSRLVREFLEQASAAAEIAMLQGRCLPYGDGVTYFALSQVLAADAGIRDDDPTTVAVTRIREAVHSRMPDDGTGAGLIAEALAFTVGLGDPQWRISRMDAAGAKRSLQAAWTTYLSLVATDAPLVVVIEDIHWAETALLDLLEAVVAGATGPLLVLCASRPDLVARRPGWGGGGRSATAVTLDPLPTDSSRELLDSLVAVDGLPDSLRQRILTRSEGNPFFLEEILRQLIDGGAIERTGDAWTARPGIEEVEIPDSVQAALAARIGLLEPADRALLQAAAVVGRTFWAEPAALLVGVSDDSGLEQSLQRLQERELIGARLGSSLTGQSEYHFKHILTRDVAYEAIPRRERMRAHAQVGAWIERTTGDRAAEFSELLASHYGTAATISQDDGLAPPEGVREHARHWLVAAATTLCCSSVIDKALRLANRALELSETPAERAEAESALALAYNENLQGDLGWEHGLRAVAAAQEAGLDPLVQVDLIADALELPLRWPGMMSFEPPEEFVRQLCDRALALVGTEPTRHRARILAMQASWPFAYAHAVDETDLDEYRDIGQQAADIARRLGDADLESAALDAVTAVDSYRGDYRGGLAAWERRWEILDAVSDDREIADIHAMGAWSYWELGEYERALEVIAHLRDRSDRLDLLHAQAWQGAALFQLGRWDELLAVYDRMRTTLGEQAASPPPFASHALCMTGAVLALRGDRQGSDTIWQIMANIPPSSPRQSVLAQFALSRGDLDRAEELLAARHPSWRIHAGMVLQAACDATLARGRWQHAAVAAAAARQHATDFGVPTLAASADRLEGAALAADGDRAGLGLLERAVTGFEQLGIPLDTRRSLQVLARAQDRVGDTAASRHTRIRAEELRRQLRIVTDPLFDDPQGGDSTG